MRIVYRPWPGIDEMVEVYLILSTTPNPERLRKFLGKFSEQLRNFLEIFSARLRKFWGKISE